MLYMHYLPSPSQKRGKQAHLPLKAGSCGISVDLVGFHRIPWDLSGSRGNSGVSQGDFGAMEWEIPGCCGWQEVPLSTLDPKEFSFCHLSSKLQRLAPSPSPQGPCQVPGGSGPKAWVTPQNREKNWALGAANLIRPAGFWWGTAGAQTDVCRVQGDRNSSYYPWGLLFFPSAGREGARIHPKRPRLSLSEEQPWGIAFSDSARGRQPATGELFSSPKSLWGNVLF